MADDASEVGGKGGETCELHSIQGRCPDCEVDRRERAIEADFVRLMGIIRDVEGIENVERV